MALAKCEYCQRRPGETLHSVYWAWFRADGVRQAQKARLCTDCLAAKVLPLDIERTAEQRLTCPNCGIDTEDDYDAVYGTVFIKGSGARQVEAPFCGACAAHFRVWALSGGAPLEDRRRADSSPTTNRASSEVLRDLGWLPRV